jgi:iron complex transport system substrate-binding protein
VFKRIAMLAVGLAASASVLSGCGTTASIAAAHHSHPIKLVDDLHQTVVLAKPATRIVALEPSNAEIVLDLGLKRKVVGMDDSVFQYTPAPWHAELKGIANIGPSYPGISVEKIVAAKPDLVIASTGIKGLSDLKQFHIPVLILNPASIAGVYHDITLVGEATGKTRQAQAVIRQMKAQMGSIERKVKTTHQRPKVFYDLGGLYTAGPHSFINSLIDLAGAVNVGASMSTQSYPLVTAEQVVNADPDDILIDSSAGTTVSQEDHRAGFSAITAVKTGHVYVMPNSSYIDEPSPALVMGLKELVHIIHPHLAIGD